MQFIESRQMQNPIAKVTLLKVPMSTPHCEGCVFNKQDEDECIHMDLTDPLACTEKSSTRTTNYIWVLDTQAI